MNKTIKKTFILLMIIGLVSSTNIFGAEDQNSRKETIKIAYLPITHALPLLAEAELYKNKFKNIDLDLVKFGSWPELMDALNAGKVDGASVLIELGIKAKEQGIPLKAVALGHRDGNVVVVAKEIKNTADLKGKIFAIPHRLSTHHILLYKLLKNAGLNFNDLKVIELPPPEMPAALAEKRISGYVVAEPFGAKAVANGHGKILYKSEELWKNSICCALVVREELLKNQRAAAQEFVADYIKAGKFVSSGGPKVTELAKKYLKVEDNVLNLSLKWISYKKLRINETDYNELIKNMVELDLVKAPPTYGDFVDNSFIDGLKKL